MLTGPVMKVGIPEAFTSRTEPAGGQADNMLGICGPRSQRRASAAGAGSEFVYCASVGDLIA